jgi:hypothetical protein
MKQGKQRRRIYILPQSKEWEKCKETKLHERQITPRYTFKLARIRNSHVVGLDEITRQVSIGL